jgi:coenzyme F420 hydrogenase subunit beta
MKMSNDLSDVIGGGFCIGCGACAAYAGSPYKMEFSDGRYLPVPNEKFQSDTQVERVCPFSDASKSEDELAKEAFSSQSLSYSRSLGFFARIGAMSVRDDAERLMSSSGGTTTWLLKKLLETGEVDAVLHVQPRQPDQSDPRLFAYARSTTAVEIGNGASSRYYPVTMEAVLKAATTGSERLAVVGVPCFIKAIRLLSLHDERIRRSVAFTVGLVCGHLKTAGFAELLAAQIGFDPSQIRGIDFRVKFENRPANQYGVEVEFQQENGKTGRAQRVNRELFGTDWGHSFFKHKSCDFCDDIFAETADVVVGDAWLPDYVRDWKGTSIVLVRNPRLEQLLDDGCKSGELKFDPLTVSDLVASQKANFSHRRADLPFRLMAYDATNRWRPRKRFERPTADVSPARKRVIELRPRVAQLTNRVWRESRQLPAPEDAVGHFKSKISPLLGELQYYTLQAKFARRSRRAAFRDGVAVAASCTAKSLAVAWPKQDQVALIVPPSSPGSLGDEAVLRSTLTELERRGIDRFVFFSYSDDDDWSHLDKRIDSISVRAFLTYRSTRDALRMLYHRRSAKRLFVCGTDVLDGHHNLGRSLGRIATIKLIADSGLPTTILGASFSEEAEPATRYAIERIPANVTFCARDPISFDVMQRIRAEGTKLVADPAFLLQPDLSSESVKGVTHWIHSQQERGQVVLGLNVNHFLTNNAPSESVVSAFAKLLERLGKERPELSVCLIPHDNRGSPSDIDIAEQVLERVTSVFGDRCSITPESLNASQIKGVASLLDVVFSGKMHLSIAALGSGVPVGCITYKDKKFHGLFAHFGLEEWLLPEESWRAEHTLYAFVSSLIDERAGIKVRIVAALPRVKKLSFANFEELS